MKLKVQARMLSRYVKMKSSEFIFENKSKGTYAGVRFGDDTKDAVKEYIAENDIPNATPTDKLHCTLLYSRKYCPHYDPQGALEPVMRGKPGAFQIWEGQPDDDGHKPNCLIMEFDCATLVDRHNELMEEHQATFDYPEYKTHITFSYDIGEMDIKDLPAFSGPINIIEEYGEDLDLDWAENNGKEE